MANSHSVEQYNDLEKRGILKKEHKRPIIDPYIFYWESYLELCTCVNSNGVIPFTAIAEFAKIFEIEDFETFNYLIRRLEAPFLTKKKKNGKPDKKDNNSG